VSANIGYLYSRVSCTALVGVVAILFAGSAAVAVRGAAEPPAVFTAAQAEAGRREVQTNTFGKCTDCHGATLTGRTGAPGERPPVSSLPADYQQLIAGNGGRVPSLVGSTFIARWARRSTKDLTREFEGRFGTLSEATRLNVIAYFLRESGAQPGPEPLTTTTDVTIGALVLPPESN
jgi:cytochrome c553